MDTVGDFTPRATPTRGLWLTLSDAFWREDELGIIGQLEEAWSCKLAVAIAAIWAGTVPIGVYVLTHVEGIHLLEVAFESWTPRHWVAFGGLLFSASSVWGWGRTFYNGLKSALWVMLLEGCMIFSKTEWLQVYVLVLIVFTNMMAAGSRAAQKEKKRRAANAREHEATSTHDSAVPVIEKLMAAEATAPTAGAMIRTSDSSGTRKRSKPASSAGLSPVPAVRVAISKVSQSSTA